MSIAAATPFKPFYDASELVDRPAELRRRMRQDGYLFFPKLLQVESVERLRLDILRILRRYGLLDEDAPLEKGVYKGGDPPGREALLQFHLEINKLESFEALAREPALMEVMSRLIDGHVHVHTRKICRVKYPFDPYDIVLPHQDFWYIRGAHDTYSAWLPLMAMDDQVGGLAAARGSHTLGPLPHQVAERSRFAGISDETAEGLDWRRSSFQQGGALIFHSLTAHQGLLNRSPYIRLSMDCRYQREGTAMQASHSRPHFES